MTSSSPSASGPATTAVLIPVKSFELAKGRLAEALEPSQRSELARSMATKVVAAAKPLPTFVVCSGGEVAEWAEQVGAQVILVDQPGLNVAVTNGAKELERQGFHYVIVAHGDLPLARDLTWLATFDGVSVVSDRRGDGTNVLGLPLGVGFEFHYGPGSARAHRTEARRVGLVHRTVEDDELGWDVDTPDDLDLPELTLRPNQDQPSQDPTKDDPNP